MQQLFQMTPDEIRGFHATIKKQIANTVSQLQQLEVGLEELRAKEVYARGMVDFINHAEKSKITAPEVVPNPAIPEGNKEVANANTQ